MAGLLSTDNAIAWAQFQLRGGWKSISLNAGGYFLLICGAIMLTCRLSGDRNLNNTLAGWTMGLLGLQALFIVIIGGMRVTTAIKQDITTGIMESHRMMPVPALHAIAGYLLGTMTAALGFFVANVAIGLATTLMAGNPAGRWIGANLVLLLFTIFLWVLFAFAAFTTPKGVGALFSVVPTIGWISQGAMFNVLPGMGVMAGPLLGGTIFSMRSNTTELSGPVITSAAVQFLMGSIFFAGAMRKYRRPEGLALGVVLSRLLLLIWVACNMLAFLRPADFHIGMRWKQNENAAYIGAMISSMLVALVPLANGARMYVQWLKRRVDDPQAKAALPPVVLAIMSRGDNVVNHHGRAEVSAAGGSVDDGDGVLLLQPGGGVRHSMGLSGNGEREMVYRRVAARDRRPAAAGRFVGGGGDERGPCDGNSVVAGSVGGID